MAFKISEKWNFGLKIHILKMLSKNSDSSTHTATLEMWWHLIHKMTNLKKWGCVFFNFLIGVLLRPQMVIWRHAIFSLEIWWHLCHKMTHLKNEKIHFRVKILGQDQISTWNISKTISLNYPENLGLLDLFLSKER